jgi:hypothetical protein
VTIILMKFKNQKLFNLKNYIKVIQLNNGTS